MPRGTERLVAPELRVALERYPDVTMSSATLSSARSAVAQLQREVDAGEREGVSVSEVFIEGSGSNPRLRILVYRPQHFATQLPAILEIHGGGFVLGTADMSASTARQYVLDHGCVVVSVDYRLAPEAKYPAALEDCYAALTWLNEQAEALGIDRNRIAVAGSSAGGGHAAALAIYVRQKGEYAICLQVLDQPMLDDRTGSSADPHPFCGEFGHTAESNRFGWQSLLDREPGTAMAPQEIIPARTADLAGLPPAFLSVGGLDLFLDETIEYSRRLLRAGVPAELHVFPGGIHGWELAADAPQTANIKALRRDALTRAFKNAPHGDES